MAVRKWFIIFAILIVGVLAALWWLGSEVETSKPEPGEVRVEIDNAF
ncbi:cell envelope integrity protein TolA [Henriciella aquimarina]|nr:cell envelope integrity protein TolA [Henriciella aquimarina]